jgi:hypothetical protein
MTKRLDEMTLSEIVELSELEIQGVSGGGGRTSLEFSLSSNATSREHIK